MGKWLIYISLLFVFLTSKLYSQYIPIEEQKARLIWEMQKYMVWENDQFIDQIIIGTYNCPSEMLQALERFKPSRFATGIDYKIVNCETLDDLKYFHIFYLPSEYNFLAKDIFDFFDSYSTIIITDEWYNKERLMINIFVESSGQQVNFEYNQENIINHGVSLMPGFEDLGGIDLNAKKLLTQLRKELLKVELELKEKEKELNQKLLEVEKQKRLISEQNKYIRQQEMIISQRQQEIAQQKAHLQQLFTQLRAYQDRFNQQVEMLKKKEEEIKRTQQELTSYRQKIQRTQQKLKQQQVQLQEQQQKMKQIAREVEKKQRQLQKLNFTITMQRFIIASFFLALIIIAVLAYFIYRSYKVQKQQNKLLQEQKAKIEAQAEQLEKLSIVASETINAVAIIRANGNFEWVNEGFVKLYGYTLSELKSVYEGFVTSFNPLLKEPIKLALEQKDSISKENMFVTKDGRTIWLQSNITPIYHDNKLYRIIIVDTDISKLKEAEEKILEQNRQIRKQAKELEQKNLELAKLSIVAEKTDNGVIIADSSGEIEWVNPGFERMMGMSFKEFKRTFGTNIIFADLDEQTLTLIENAIKEHQSAEFIFKMQTPQGKLLWLRSTLTPMFDDEGFLLKLFSINADITEIKLAQEKIEKQNRDIRRSIQYAQRIQQAALPQSDFIQSILPEHFILFLPRDIVSGDFYWLTQIKDKILFAAADCTGHGVPGAFMSMLGIAFLNEIVGKLEYEQLQPNLILNILREYVIRFLKQEYKTGTSKDGMDIAFCMIDTRKRELHFAGANNPLWIVRNREFIEIPGDDMPIGIYYNAKESFTNNVITYYKGDLLYLFSDGYADQFGGPRGKKFMIKRFRMLIKEISDLPLKTQNKILYQAHLDWKGNRRQLDDILVMGVKV